MKNRWAHCHDVGASHHFLTGVTVFFLMHLSATEELRCSIPLLLSGLKEHTHGEQHLHDKKTTVIITSTLVTLSKPRDKGDFQLEEWAFVSGS